MNWMAKIGVLDVCVDLFGILICVDVHPLTARNTIPTTNNAKYASKDI